MPTLYCCGNLRSPGSQSGPTVHSDYVTTMMAMIMKNERLVLKWRVKLDFRGTYRLS